MNLRASCLPRGWYPQDKTEIQYFLEPFLNDKCAMLKAFAAIAPHAGWYYSGALAALAVSSLDKEAETVAVLGGHLPSGSPFLFAEEDGAETPFGAMPFDKELLHDFKHELTNAALPFQADSYTDNTVEALLPMVHYFFPKAQLLWARFPANLCAYTAGALLEKSAKALGRNLRVIASTDLTHYGTNYGFFPKGKGIAALDWVKNVNDAAFINAVLSLDKERILSCAELQHASCSAGAVLGTIAFAQAHEKKPALLDYYTSADVGADGESQSLKSFVGYAAFTFT
jgi:AmmeMemoRadiSam system protein B